MKKWRESRCRADLMYRKQILEIGATRPDPLALAVLRVQGHHRQRGSTGVDQRYQYVARQSGGVAEQ